MASPSDGVPHVNELPGPSALKRVVVRASDPRQVELALEDPPVRRFTNLSITREDKEATDSVQAWYSFRVGRRVPLWELYNLILAEALENERGRFFRMTERSWV